MNSEANFTNFWPENLRAHSQPGTRAVHLACTLTGSPLLVAAVALRRWWWFALALAVPCALAWISHFFVEHNRPAVLHKKVRSEEHTSELQSHSDLVCRLLLEKK